MSLRMVLNCKKKVLSKLDGVFVTGSDDDAALPAIIKKNKNGINNFKNLQKVLFMSFIHSFIHSFIQSVSQSVSQSLFIHGTLT